MDNKPVISILQALPSEEARNSMTGWFKKRLLGNNSVAEWRAVISILQALPSEEARNSMTGWFKKRFLGNNSVIECRAVISILACRRTR